jgi:CRISP-associated protein Cas1
MARQILNTLYVMTPNSYLHLENDTLRVDIEHEKKLQVAPAPRCGRGLKRRPL